MREFLTGWYPGLKPDTPRPGVPAALAELYAVAAGRPEVLGTQNEVYARDELRTHPQEGLLVFAAENQGNFSWLVDPAEEDPVVWLAPPHEGPVAEREPLSGFLVQFCLFEAIAAGPPHAGCWGASAAQAREATAQLREVPLAPWLWPADPTRFFAGPDLLLCTSTFADGDVQIIAAARSATALAPLTDTDVPWDLFDD